jgi:hypothetical protein
MSFKAIIEDVFAQAVSELVEGFTAVEVTEGYPATVAEFRTALGLANQPDIEHELKQTIRWKERTLGGYCTGTQYKKLEWEYSGNKGLRWDEYGHAPGQEPLKVQEADVWGYLLYIEGYSPEDKLCLGDPDNANECVKGTDRTPDPGPNSWAGQSGVDQALPPTDYKMTSGTFQVDNSTQPKKVITDSNRVADKFIVKHSTLVVAYDFKFWVPVTINGIARKFPLFFTYNPWGEHPWPVEVKRPEEE